MKINVMYRIGMLFALCVILLYFLCPLPVYRVFGAETDETAFDHTDVLSDLQSIAGFDIKTYLPASPGTHTAGVFHFTEYCYSNVAVERADYGLYVYFYNPDLTDIYTDSQLNQITLAVKYKTNSAGYVVADDYEKFDLKFCGKTLGEIENLFYKFKVVDHISADKKTIETRVSSDERRYDITEVEIYTRGNDNAAAYPVGYSFYFSGYAKGYGLSKDESTLQCRTEKLETIELDVHSTFWRSESSAAGAVHQNQINSVYFAVPNRYLEEYGTLQRIKAEWYEFETKDIFVMDRLKSARLAAAYEYFQKNIGVEFPNSNENGVFKSDDDGTRYSLTSAYHELEMSGFLETDWLVDWGLNGGFRSSHIKYAQSIDFLYWLFDSKGEISEYDPFADLTEQGGVQSNRLYDYMKSYDKTHNSGYLPVKNEAISADLFETDIQESRKKETAQGVVRSGYEGKSYYDFDASVDIIDMQSWSSLNPSFLDKWKYFGLWSALSGSGLPSADNRSVVPIQTLTYTDLQNKSAADISREYMVANSEAANFMEFTRTASDNDSTVVLFRFAQTDYISEATTLVYSTPGEQYVSFIDESVYRAKQTVFFDFDIIQLTFQDGEDLTVIGVAASPIDIVNPITPPIHIPDGSGFDKIALILGVIMLIILLVILQMTGILPLIFKLVGWIILLPFRLIKAAFKAIRRSGKKYTNGGRK